jgi:hypothetical protein
MKYRIVKEGTTYYIQFAKHSSWAGTQDWQWYTHRDSENHPSRQRYEYFDDARAKVAEMTDFAYDVIWTSP